STNFYPDANSYLHGMYRSDDTGATWHYVYGPSHSRDTRFVVTGCNAQVVYAFDALGGVWKTTDGGDGTLGPACRFAADSIRWAPNACGDTLSFEAFASNCLPISVDSVAIIFGSEFLRLPHDGKLPKDLSLGDSAQVMLL